MPNVNDWQHLIDTITGAVLAAGVLFFAIAKCLLSSISSAKKAVRALPFKNCLGGISCM
jgi:hypothetical protein